MHYRLPAPSGCCRPSVRPSATCCRYPTASSPAGSWLEALGFTTGQKIEVITGPGQLIIRLATEG
ncbi:SymE family type I addiction module toxin [Pantoea vagans]|uniref:SymE family type I addiction module toxin n=1 Tax=Pantoea vagans TaxID=470934 RepID=UPI003AAAF623